MSALVLTVRIKIKADCVEQFMSALMENAGAARSTEPGCLQFDVLVDPEDRTRLMLYEVYRDAAAFEAHQQTPHFKKYLDTALGWLESRERQFYRRAAP
jgi:(4S)-4-hydroxy-5-phosphonooxypentane-2,3-dione isomerase